MRIALSFPYSDYKTNSISAELSVYTITIVMLIHIDKVECVFVYIHK